MTAASRPWCDQHTSALEGSIGAIPRRVMVGEVDAGRARALIEEAGLFAEAVVIPNEPGRTG